MKNQNLENWMGRAYAQLQKCSGHYNNGQMEQFKADMKYLNEITRFLSCEATNQYEYQRQEQEQLYKKCADDIKKRLG